ncbi:MAG: hypothetical protein LBT66_06055 [Methanobrevibacter sp.]|jgi:uncharacterized protein YycO|nr:hypothetical protein [Candidatus Methanovirga meridionalis]
MKYKILVITLIAILAISSISAVSANPSLNSLSIGHDKQWYTDIDINNPFNEGQPNYNKYNLLNALKPGDVIYSPTGFYNTTGHIFILEDVFKDPNSNKSYIRCIEAGGYITNNKIVAKVFYSILDDDRIDNSELEVYRLNDGLNASQLTTIFDFLKPQIGKPYSVITGYPLPYSIDTNKWYCSLLVWAAYKNIGIDIQSKNSPFANLIVLPAEISKDSKLLTRVDLQ